MVGFPWPRSEKLVVPLLLRHHLLHSSRPTQSLWHPNPRAAEGLERENWPPQHHPRSHGRSWFSHIWFHFNRLWHTTHSISLRRNPTGIRRHSWLRLRLLEFQPPRRRNVDRKPEPFVRGGLECRWKRYLLPVPESQSAVSRFHHQSIKLDDHRKQRRLELVFPLQHLQSTRQFGCKLHGG